MSNKDFFFRFCLSKWRVSYHNFHEINTPHAAWCQAYCYEAVKHKWVCSLQAFCSFLSHMYVLISKHLTITLTTKLSCSTRTATTSVDVATSLTTSAFFESVAIFVFYVLEFHFFLHFVEKETFPLSNVTFSTAATPTPISQKIMVQEGGIEYI